MDGVDLSDLKLFLAIILLAAGILLLPKTLENTLYLFPALFLMFLGFAVAVKADD